MNNIQLTQNQNIVSNNSLVLIDNTFENTNKIYQEQLENAKNIDHGDLLQKKTEIKKINKSAKERFKLGRNQIIAGIILIAFYILSEVVRDPNTNNQILSGLNAIIPIFNIPILFIGFGFICNGIICMLSGINVFSELLKPFLGIKKPDVIEKVKIEKDEQFYVKSYNELHPSEANLLTQSKSFKNNNTKHKNKGRKR